MSAPGGIGAQSGAEAVVHARLKQARVKAQGHESAGYVGTDEHETKFGCDSGAGGCRLACDGATRPSGSNVDRCADEEISGSEGNSSAAGGGSRASLGQLVAAGGDKVTTKESEAAEKKYNAKKRELDDTKSKLAYAEAKLRQLRCRG